jgi:hypothetical protein
MGHYTATELLKAQREHDAAQRQINQLNLEIGRRISERSAHERTVERTRLILEGKTDAR